MTDLKDFFNDITQYAVFPEKADADKIVSFLVDNNWFDCKPTFTDGKVLLTDEQVATLTAPLIVYLSKDGTSETLLQMMTEKLPSTCEQFIEFCTEEHLSEDSRFYLADFLLYYLKKDIVLYSDDEVNEFLKYATSDMTKEHGDILTFFLAWLRATKTTNFHRDYTMEKRYRMDIQNEAYDFDEYLELLYYLFNEDYIEDNAMYELAAESMNYTDTWLYLAMHFICSIRYPDLMRIYHPDLPYPAEDILNKIHEGEFTDNDARYVLLSITTRMCLLPFTPNKTAGTSGVGAVKLTFPANCEIHFGKLFALAEAHRQVQGCTDIPIIRKITTYQEISRYMGDEIGELFLESNFRSRSATKSYLQSIYLLSDDILGEEAEGPSVKGYILSALARSHKGSYGEFATTTIEYLKDAKMSGLSPEFIVFELLQRGVLSFIPSTMLKMVTSGAYNKLNFQNQTQMIMALDLSPKEIESIVSTTMRGKRWAEMAVKEVITSETDILTALHRIGSGQAFSKQPECLCLITALGKLCPFDKARQCVGCKYEISTKSTFFLLISEFNRLKTLYENAASPLEKQRCKKLVQEAILPKLDEMLYCIKENYGEEIYIQYNEMLREYV